MKKNKHEEIKASFLDYMVQEIEKLECEPILKETINYNLIGSGKYFRSVLLLLLVSENREYQDFFDLAMAIEMIHTYSLIHDDLPAMDNDDYRRGKLTTHKKFSEDVAILTGDALLTHAFEKIIQNKHLSAEQRLKLIQAFVNASGVSRGMINGQLLDIKNTDKTINEQLLVNLHLQKTGKMIALPFIVYEIINELDLGLEEIGLEIGLLFQIIDDYLDSYSTFDKIGKPTGSDEKLNKDTFVNFYSKKELEQLLKKRKELIQTAMKENNINNDAQIFIEKILKW